MIDQDAAAAGGLPPASMTPRNDNIVVPKKQITNIKPRTDIFNYDNNPDSGNNKNNRAKNQNGSPVNHRLNEHFGLQPFQHHHM